MALLLFVGAGCARLTSEALPSRQIDSSFVDRVFTWTSGDRVAFAIKVFGQGGRTAVCGALAESPGTDRETSSFNDLMIPTLRLELRGKTLLNDLTWFARGAYDRGSVSGTANCRLTRMQWEAYTAQDIALMTTRERFKILD